MNGDVAFASQVTYLSHRYNKAAEGKFALSTRGETAAQKANPERRLWHMCNVCFSLHKVYAFSPEVEERRKRMSPSKLNPLYLSCTCKGFHHHSVCSHLIAVGQMLEVVDVKRLLGRIKNPSRGGIRGFTHRHAAAYNRMQPLSSSSEDDD